MTPVQANNLRGLLARLVLTPWPEWLEVKAVLADLLEEASDPRAGKVRYLELWMLVWETSVLHRAPDYLVGDAVHAGRRLLLAQFSELGRVRYVDTIDFGRSCHGVQYTDRAWFWDPAGGEPVPFGPAAAPWFEGWREVGG